MSQAPGAAGANEIVKQELDPPASPPPPPCSQAMAAAAGSTYATAVEIGLGYEQLGRPAPSLKQQGVGLGFAEPSKKNFPSPAPSFMQVPAYTLEPSRGAFGSLATQDFLQPLERGANGNVVAKAVSQGVNGDVPLQLNSRSERNEQSLTTSTKDPSRIQFQMQYGYMDHGPNSLFPKNGFESNQIIGMNRHWQQGHVNDANKRPRSTQSEGDENESEDRRKLHKGETGSKDELISRSIDVKGSTSRSKHSATEQRRRSKINDRFQMLRDLLPHGDQKRDKASFLLEVIEYVQTLQEKVKKFEALEKGRYQERLKVMPWDIKSNPNLKDMSDINKEKATFLESKSTAQDSRVIGGRTRQVPLVPMMSSIPVAEDLEASKSEELEEKKQCRSNDSSRNTSKQSVPEDHQHVETNGGKELQDDQLPIKKGLISLSTAYSQGLLETLTSALQNSGLDLSKANISVQIELGKPQEKKA